MSGESNTAVPPRRRHEAYHELPQPSLLGAQLREVFDLSQAFEGHLGRALGCNPTDLAAMRHLVESGPMTPTELATRLGVSSAAATMVVDRLGALGHVSRAPHDTDRRKVVVVPAESSVEAAIGELMPIIVGVARAVEGLDDRDRAVVEGFLATVLDVYRQALSATPAPS